ncbi:MAG: peptidoglycan domain protein [Bacteroidales bacterium]|nr:peptidoglycan domain protein [Bacteroidales bacterium]
MAAVIVLARRRRGTGSTGNGGDSSDRFNTFADFVLSWEGGFVNNPADSGGATCKGVTMATFKRWRKEQGRPAPTVADLKAITDSEVKQILKAYYWDKWRADEIKSQSLANILVDYVWGAGTYGIKYPQQLLGVDADGVVGPKTLAAVNGKDPETLFKALKARREQHFRNIAANNPSSQQFLTGWLRRLDGIGYGYLRHNGGKTVTFEA